MAFADLGGLGTANSKTSGTTVALTTSQTVNVGDLIVVMMAWDNTDTSGFDGLRHYVTDSAGNFYRYLGQYVGGTAAANGSECGIFGSVAEAQLSSGGTITCTSVTARTAKAISARRFSLGTSDICLVQKATNNGFNGGSGQDPAAISLSSLPSREYLLLHCLGSAGPSTDSFTWDSDYTQLTVDGTTGGVDNTNMSVLGGFRIATLTSDTVDVTNNTSSARTNTQVFVAIREYTRSPDPDAGVLDSFTRADENPLAAPWSKIDASGLKLVTNRVGTVSAALSRGSERSGPANDFQGYVTVAVLPPVNAAAQIGFGAHFSGEGAGNTWNGYTVTIEPRSGVPGSVRVAYTQGGNLGSDIGQPKIIYQYPGLAAGDLLGMKTLGDTLEFWWKTGGAWRMFGAVDDTTARNAKTGMIIGDTGTAARVDDFAYAGIILPSFIASVSAVYTPGLNGYIQDIPFINSVTALYALKYNAQLPCPFIASTTVVYTPTLPIVPLGFISSTTTVYALTFLGYVAVPFIGSVTVVYTPLVTQPEIDVPFIASRTHVWAIFTIYDAAIRYGGPGNGGEVFGVRLAPNGMSVTATLTRNISSSDGIVHVAGDGSWPSDAGFVVTVGSEVIGLRQTSAGVYRVWHRALSNTTAVGHSIGDDATWDDTYDQAITAGSAIANSFTANINSTGSFTYPGWLICFDSSQAYLSGDRYPMHVTEVLGVFDAGVGTTGSSRTDGPQPNAIAAPATTSDDCPAALSNPSRIDTDIDVGDVAVVRFTNPEASVLDLGPRSVSLQSWFGLKRVSTSDADVTFTDPNGIVVDTTGTYDTFTGSVNGEWDDPVPLVTGIAPDASDVAGFAVPTPNPVAWTTVTLPKTDRFFTRGSGHGGYDEKGWPMCCLAVRQGNRRVPHWASWDWHNYAYVYTGFGIDATYAQILINRNGVVFDSVPVVDLPNNLDIDGPDTVWDDGTYFIGASWYVVLFNTPYIVFGPTIGGTIIPIGPGGGTAAPGVSFGGGPSPDGGTVSVPPTTIEGGEGGDISPTPSGIHIWQRF